MIVELSLADLPVLFGAEVIPSGVRRACDALSSPGETLLSVISLVCSCLSFTTTKREGKPTMKIGRDERSLDLIERIAREATDGCRVEPDGICEHGQPSWLLHLGSI